MVINHNIASLNAYRSLSTSNSMLGKSLEKLSTGLRINAGKDDPAGLIASESLRAEKNSLSTAITNAQRAEQVINVAEGGLQEVSGLLTELQSLVSQSANSGALSQDEIAANQLQVDSILQTVDRIANSTSFQGTKLLNGKLDYTTDGVNATNISDLQVKSANLGSAGSMTVSVEITAAATQATRSITGTGTDTATFDFSGAVEISGNLGSEVFQFETGTTAADIVKAINVVTKNTGVTASVEVDGNGENKLVLKSTDYGSGASVDIKTIDGTAVASNRASGTDATGTVNGTTFNANGNDISFKSANLDLSFTVAAGITGLIGGVDSHGQASPAGTPTFSITGGGANFQVGANAIGANVASVGIQSVTTSTLGNSTTGFLNSLGTGQVNSLSSTDPSKAQAIVDAAIKEVSQMRGQLGAFQKFQVGSTISSLGVALENTTAAESTIRDTDFAAETANLTRAQILTSAATATLAVANQAPQTILKLLG